MEERGEVQFLDHFTIHSKLRSGHNWGTYQALDRRLNKEVALKVVSVRQGFAFEEFRKEARLLAEISHPNIVSLYDFDCSHHSCYIVSEFVEGVNFLEYVRPGSDAAGGARSLDESRLRLAWGQLVAAIAALHNKGLIHRDLKPSHVLVTKQSRLVINDFAHGMEGFELVGTPYYLAPEIEPESPVTPASDWYSAGVMLYQALTDQLPYTGKFFEVMAQKQMSDPVSPIELVPTIPSDFNNLCMRLLARDPLQRPTAGEVVTVKTDSPDDSRDAAVPARFR